MLFFSFKCLHALQSSNNDHAHNFGAYKLDLSKAYDRGGVELLGGSNAQVGTLQ